MLQIYYTFCIMLKAYKYRLFPIREQKEILAKQFGCARFVYNWGLAEKIKAYTTSKKTLSCFDLTNQLTKKKKEPEFEWLQETYAQVLQMSLRNLDNAFTAFFRKQNRFPKFKHKNSKQSTSYPQGIKVDFDNQTIRIPKVGWVTIVIDRKFEGKIKTVTVSKTVTDKYFANILVEDDKPLPDKVNVTEEGTVGVDVGLKDFAILSTGEKIPNPKYLRNAEIRLAVKQRQLSRKKKGSNKRIKAKKDVALVYEKISNQRSDFIHKISSKLISENQAVVIEDLNISGMLKNHCLAKGISDVAWSKLFGFLAYKSDWYGKTLIQIGRFSLSSKICNICGEVNHNLKLSDREWVCSECKTKHDRDINAAINIKKFGLLGGKVISTRINKATLSG